MNQWNPMIYHGTTKVELKRDANYHLITDMADKAIAWMGQQKSLTPDKPFFLYFAPGATHAPHHAPKEWIAKYKGQVRHGLGQDARTDLRAAEEEGNHPCRLQNQPATQRNPGVDSFSASEQKLFARQMETFAGYAEFTDHQVGRLVDYLDVDRPAR